MQRDFQHLNSLFSFLPINYFTCHSCGLHFCLQNFGSRSDTVFCGVFDGHGPYGHMVARRVRDSLPLKLSAHWEVNIGNHEFVSENSISTTGSLTSEDTILAFRGDKSRNSVYLQEKKGHSEIFTTLKESFLKAFKVMDKELKLHPSIDCFCSGTTAVTLIKQVRLLGISQGNRHRYL